MSGLCHLLSAASSAARTAAAAAPVLLDPACALVAALLAATVSAGLLVQPTSRASAAMALLAASNAAAAGLLGLGLGALWAALAAIPRFRWPRATPKRPASPPVHACLQPAPQPSAAQLHEQAALLMAAPAAAPEPAALAPTALPLRALLAPATALPAAVRRVPPKPGRRRRLAPGSPLTARLVAAAQAGDERGVRAALAAGADPARVCSGRCCRPSSCAPPAQEVRCMLWLGGQAPCSTS